MFGRIVGSPEHILPEICTEIATDVCTYLTRTGFSTKFVKIWFRIEFVRRIIPTMEISKIPLYKKKNYIWSVRLVSFHIDKSWIMYNIIRKSMANAESMPADECCRKMKKKVDLKDHFGREDFWEKNSYLWIPQET